MTHADDDTQPRSPFEKRPPGGDSGGFASEPLQPDLNQPPDAEGDDAVGPGCAVWGVLGAIVLVFGLAVVAMAGVAGWTTGQRIAETNATATQDHRIMEQVIRIPTDAAGGNQSLLIMRLEFLAEQTPGIGGLADLQALATGVYLTAQPTIMPTATLTPPDMPTATAIATMPPTDSAPVVVATASGEGVDFDINALFSEAERLVALGQYEDAIDLLDSISGLDPNYRTAEVNALLSRALTTHAAALFGSLDTIAEGIFYTDRAEEIGADIGELSYERLVGSLYLNAARQTDLGDYGAAIRAWQALLSYQPTYKGIDIRRQIFDQYVLFGDAWVFGGQPCRAVPEYTNALNLFNSAQVSGKRDAAQQACANATPTLDPNAPTPPPGAAPTIAPIGVPGT